MKICEKVYLAVPGGRGKDGVDGKDGKDGVDGTGITIQGSYTSLEELISEHSTGNIGDAYIIAGELYIWDKTESKWKSVGNIQGQKGEDGKDGKDGKDGINGIDGKDGKDGENGLDGNKGDKGDTGAKGDKGDTGDKGEKGDKGDTGDKGEAGRDGTGVTILGSYNSLSELVYEHPTGNIGDAYIIHGYMYVWDETNGEWLDVGNLQGPQGLQGEGWTPIISNIVDGNRVVQKISDYTGGTKDKPIQFIGKYISADGLTDNIQIATNIKGEDGKDAIQTSNILFITRDNDKAIITHETPKGDIDILPITYFPVEPEIWTNILEIEAGEDIKDNEIEFATGNRFNAKIWLTSDTGRDNSQIRMSAISKEDGTELATATSTVNIESNRNILIPVIFENIHKTLKVLKLSDIKVIISLKVQLFGAQIGIVTKLPNELSYIVHSSTVSTFTDAPSDDNIYGRKNGDWAEVVTGGEKEKHLVTSKEELTELDVDLLDIVGVISDIKYSYGFKSTEYIFPKSDSNTEYDKWNTHRKLFSKTYGKYIISAMLYSSESGEYEFGTYISDNDITYRRLIRHEYEPLIEEMSQMISIWGDRYVFCIKFRSELKVIDLVDESIYTITIPEITNTDMYQYVNIQELNGNYLYIGYNIQSTSDTFISNITGFTAGSTLNAVTNTSIVGNLVSGYNGLYSLVNIGDNIYLGLFTGNRGDFSTIPSPYIVYVEILNQGQLNRLHVGNSGYTLEIFRKRYNTVSKGDLTLTILGSPDYTDGILQTIIEEDVISDSNIYTKLKYNSKINTTSPILMTTGLVDNEVLIKMTTYDKTVQKLFRVLNKDLELEEVTLNITNDSDFLGQSLVDKRSATDRITSHRNIIKTTDNISGYIEESGREGGKEAYILLGDKNNIEDWVKITK